MPVANDRQRWERRECSDGGGPVERELIKTSAFGNKALREETEFPGERSAGGVGACGGHGEYGDRGRPRRV